MNPVSASLVDACGKIRCTFCGQLVASEFFILLEGRQFCESCKPQVLQMLREGVPVPCPNEEQIRRDHITHEASVKAIATLFLFGAFGAAVTAVASGLGERLWGGVTGVDPGPEMLGVVGFGSLAVLSLWVAISLFRLQRSGRTVGVALASLGLLVLPFGTVASAYILWLFLSRKGKMVFSDAYRKVVKDTPYVTARTYIVNRVLLVLLFVMISCFGHWLIG